MPLPKTLTSEEITSFQEAKAHRDFVYQTNQALQSHSQGLIGLSLSFEKKAADFISNLKATEIKFENLEKKMAIIFDNHCSEIGYKVSDMLALVEDIHDKTEDIYDNFATLEDFAAWQLDMEEKHTAVEQAQKIHAAANDSSIMITKGHLQAQIDDLRRLIDKPDTSHQQCALDLQIKRNEDSVNIAGLHKEIALLKKQCDYNQKQFEYVVTNLNRLQGRTE